MLELLENISMIHFTVDYSYSTIMMKFAFHGKNYVDFYCYLDDFNKFKQFFSVCLHNDGSFPTHNQVFTKNFDKYPLLKSDTLEIGYA